MYEPTDVNHQIRPLRRERGASVRLGPWQGGGKESLLVGRLGAAGPWRGGERSACRGDGGTLTSEGGTAVSTLKANRTPQLDRAARRVDFVVCGLYLNKAAINKRTWH